MSSSKISANAPEEWDSESFVSASSHFHNSTSDLERELSNKENLINIRPTVSSAQIISNSNNTRQPVGILRNAKQKQKSDHQTKILINEQPNAAYTDQIYINQNLTVNVNHTRVSNATSSHSYNRSPIPNTTNASTSKSRDLEKESSSQISSRSSWLSSTSSTLKSFKKGEFFDDKVPRQKAGILAYVNKQTGKEAPPPPAGSGKPAEAKDGVFDCSNDNFAATIKDKDLAIVKFFAPWCGHCKAMAQDWLDVGKETADDNKVAVINVDCTVERELCGNNGVKGYPTLKAFKKGGEYGDNLPRKKAQIIDYINKHKDAAPKKAGAGAADAKPAKAEPKSQDEDPATLVAGKVHKITTNNFDKLVMKSDKHVFLKVFAPWCGHCKKMASDWVQFAEDIQNRYDDVIVAEFDATENDLPKDYAIKGYPTLYWAEKGNKSKPEKFTGARTLDAWKAFVVQKAPEVDDSEEEIPEAAEPVAEEKVAKDEL